MRKLLTFLILIFATGLLFGQGTKSTVNGVLYVVKTTTPTIFIQGNGGVLDFYYGSSHIKLTQGSGVITLSGGDLALGANNLTLTGSIGATGARITKLWATNAEFTNTPTVGGTPLSSLYATSAQLAAITPTSLGLGYVTNISIATAFTNPDFTGTRVRLGTDTLATRAYSRANGSGGGGGGGSFATLTGSPSDNTNLQNALNLKLATNGSAAGLTSFPTLNQSTTGSAAKWTTPRLLWNNSVDGSANITSIIASAYGGTGNGFFNVAGPTLTQKTFTFPDVSSTVLTTNAAVAVAQGGTGRATGTTAYGIVTAGTTATAAQQTLATGNAGQILRSGGASALPAFSTATYPAVSGAARKFLVSNGTDIVSSTETIDAPTVAGNVYMADGTNIVSVIPVAVSTLIPTPGATGNVQTSDGAGHWVSAANAVMKHLTITPKTTSYGLLITDDGTIITMNSGSATNLTIPLNSSQAISIGATITFFNIGAGTMTFVVTGGVTVYRVGLNLATTKGASLTKLATDSWVLVGGLN